MDEHMKTNYHTGLFFHHNYNVHVIYAMHNKM